ncbi:Integrase [Streptococcus agalactiae ILRI112]|nr:Integrase [Streptococcus agalactiae ILRI112]
MAIKKTKNGTYQLRLYIPEDVQAKLGFKKLYEKRFKTKREAKEAELKISVDIEKARHNKLYQKTIKKEDILFSDFYKEVWLEPYKAGQTTSTNKPPTPATVFQTQNMFRLHILPILGNYSLSYLNENKQLVLSLLTPKANSYANFKAIRGYINSVFDWAEELEYIPTGLMSNKTISRIKAVKKQTLKENKHDEDLTLDEEELRFWLQEFDEDLKNGLIEFKDYVLFYTTFFLSDRKSESYALQWKHINFKTNEILIENALDRFGNVKATKGGKKTIFSAPPELMILLKKWKKLQKEELKKIWTQANEQSICIYLQ